MTDDEFLQAFMSCTLPHDQFHHRDHLRLVWLLIQRLGMERAGAATATGIQRFATANGHSAKYHETMTQFWVRIVDHARNARPEIEDFDRFLVAFPQLTDKHLPLRHWKPETIFSPAARATWLTPDLSPLPW